MNPYAQDEGYRAYERGRALSDNPYIENTMAWDSWNVGWTEAQSED